MFLGQSIIRFLINVIFIILYFGVIFVPFITQSVIISRLQWETVNLDYQTIFRPTAESVVQCNQILVWSAIAQTILVFIGTVRSPIDYKHKLTWIISFIIDDEDDVIDNKYWANPKFLLSFDHIVMSFVLWMITTIITLIIWRPDAITCGLVFLPIYVFVITLIFSWSVYKICL